MLIQKRQPKEVNLEIYKKQDRFVSISMIASLVLLQRLIKLIPFLFGLGILIDKK